MLTGLSDEHFAVSAVASGAQDYLIKGRVEAAGLHRSLLYAIERKRNELTVMDLHTSQLRAQENVRLERGLLPTPLLLTIPASTSSQATGPAARTPCWAEIFTTSCKPRTARCTF